MRGSELAGRAYRPLFPYFGALAGPAGAFRVVADGYVTADSGTGVVHCAPAFGEDDMRVCLANGARCCCVPVSGPPCFVAAHGPFAVTCSPLRALPTGSLGGRARTTGHCGAQASSRRALRYPALWMRTGASRRR